MPASPKTTKTKASVTDFIESVENDTRRADAKAVLKLMKEATGEKPAMWGPSIVGFGSYRSNTGDWPIAGFSPRKANLVVYIAPEFPERGALLARLGKHKTGVTCLYLSKLADVDQGVLRDIISKSVAHVRAKHG
jgi:hypothetical protein